MSDTVSNDETLYRRIKNWPGYVVTLDGICRPSSMAFDEEEYRISVDRAKLCGHNPTYTQDEPEDGVYQFYAHEVRGIVIDREAKIPNSPTVVSEKYEIDVEPKPEPDNPAH